MGGLCPGGSLSKEGSLSRGGSLSGGLCLGGGLCPGGLCRAVRILLECILVSLLVKHRLTNSLSMDLFHM